MYRIITSGAAYALILGIIAWVIAIAAFAASLFLWYKTGDYPEFRVIDYIPENWVAELTAIWPWIQKGLF